MRGNSVKFIGNSEGLIGIGLKLRLIDASNVVFDRECRE